MRYLLVGFAPVLSKAITVAVWGWPCCAGAELLVDPLPPPQPCATSTDTKASTVAALIGSDRVDVRHPLTISAPSVEARRRVPLPETIPRSSRRCEFS